MYVALWPIGLFVANGVIAWKVALETNTRMTVQYRFRPGEKGIIVR
jgi:hypothetical protein